MTLTSFLFRIGMVWLGTWGVWAQDSLNTPPLPMFDTFAIAIHGGAGNMAKKNLTPEQEAQYLDVLQRAVRKGYAQLAAGARAVDVVEQVIQILEDDPLFNAGKGSVFSYEGKNEMDAAIMDGSNRDAGAVAGVRHIKNPISGAKAVMQHSKFVLLHGEGAEAFAREQNINLVDTSYFFTQKRWDEWQQIKKTKQTKLDHDSADPPADADKKMDKMGTVGCVVLDRFGHLAAGTSTGGTVNKRYQRIGDSPLIGSGTYADDASCAVSCTGHGEDFIKAVAAYDVAAMMQYKGYSLQKATRKVIEKLSARKGRGGMIAVDARGHISMIFNTQGMFRASADQSGSMQIGIYEQTQCMPVLAE